MDLLVKTVRDFCFEQGLKKTYWVAYSGGLDSQVLLHLFSELKNELGLDVRAVHVNHGLSPNASDWAALCQQTCFNNNIPFHLSLVSLNKQNSNSLEDQARRQRYRIFADLLTELDVLITAHHQDDQAETVLLQLFRGAGPKGLAAMPFLKKLGKGFHARPLLNFRRDDLHQYARLKGLTWIEDESNQNTQFTRNFLRSSVFPLLQERWPTVSETLARVAKHCSETEVFLTEVLEEELKNVRGITDGTLSVSKLLAVSAVKQRLLLRAWLLEKQSPLPSTVKLNEMQKSLTARSDKMPVVKWSGFEMRRYQDECYVLSEVERLVFHHFKVEWSLAKTSELTVPGGCLKMIPQKNALALSDRTVSVRFRQGGERIKLNGFHQTLKNLFQTWKVPPWKRDCLPLIFFEEQLVAIPGFCVSDLYRTEPNQEGVNFELCL